MTLRRLRLNLPLFLTQHSSGVVSITPRGSFCSPASCNRVRLDTIKTGIPAEKICCSFLCSPEFLFRIFFFPSSSRVFWCLSSLPSLPSSSFFRLLSHIWAPFFRLFHHQCCSSFALQGSPEHVAIYTDRCCCQ